jgi:tRNA threonylcarbamoyladenosine biosynthesis protein TsaE
MLFRAMNFQINLLNDEKTQELGVLFAKIARQGDFFALFGDLGAGKTTFSRGFINTILASNEDIPSPTFTLLQYYDGLDCPIYHFDLYRLENPDEVWELGWEQINEGICIAEWANRAQQYLPNNRIEIEIAFNAASRIANIKIFGNGEFVKYWNNGIESFDYGRF